MKAWTEIFDPNYRFSLAKVSYQREQDIQDTAEIKVNDNTDIHIEQDHAYLSLSREIKFQPDGLFSLLIEFDAELTYTESYRAVIGESLDDEEKEKIKVLIQEQGLSVVMNLAARASTIIAELTLAAGFQPLIVPAVFSQKEDEQKDIQRQTVKKHPKGIGGAAAPPAFVRIPRLCWRKGGFSWEKPSRFATGVFHA